MEARSWPMWLCARQSKTCCPATGATCADAAGAGVVPDLSQILLYYQEQIFHLTTCILQIG